MCKAIEEMIKESNEKVREECLAESKFKIFKDLVKKGLLSVKDASEQSGIHEDEFTKES